VTATNATDWSGHRLAKLREAAGLTRYALAKRSGVNEAFLGRLEAGKQAPGWSVACKLADALGVTLDALRATPRGCG
jgi:transcriptional regulator with XRE-family HTH domain